MEVICYDKTNSNGKTYLGMIAYETREECFEFEESLHPGLYNNKAWMEYTKFEVLEDTVKYEIHIHSHDTNEIIGIWLIISPFTAGWMYERSPKVYFAADVPDWAHNEILQDKFYSMSEYTKESLTEYEEYYRFRLSRRERLKAKKQRRANAKRAKEFRRKWIGKDDGIPF